MKTEEASMKPRRAQGEFSKKQTIKDVMPQSSLRAQREAG